MLIRKSSVDRTTSGFTLTEVAIVLGIIGIILGAIWAAASKVYGNHANALASNEVIQIYNGYKALFQAKVPDAVENTDITAVGIGNSIFPSEMLRGSPPSVTLEGPWHGSTIAVTDQISLNTITITFGKLGESECTDMGAMYSGNSNSNPNVIGLDINNTKQGTMNPPAFTASTAAAACNAPDGQNTIGIILQF